MRDVADTRTALLPGEFVVYNCTSPTEPLSETGSFFAIECLNGVLSPPAKWPVCRPLGGSVSQYSYSKTKERILQKLKGSPM